MASRLLVFVFAGCLLVGSVSAAEVPPPGQVPLVQGPSSTRAEVPPWSSGELKSAAPSSADLTLQRLFTLIDERDRQYSQRFQDSEKAVNAALVAAKEAVNAALAAAKEAVTKAETANEKRLDAVNEFRGQQKDLLNTLMPRAETDIRFKAIETKLAELNDYIVRTQGQFASLAWLWGALGAMFGGLIGIAGLIVNWRKRESVK